MPKLGEMWQYPLHFFEQKFKISVKKNLPGLSWLFSGQVLTAVSALFNTTLLANFLSEEAFGTYKYLILLANIIGILTLNGLKSSAGRAVAQGYEGELYRTVKILFRWSPGIVAAGGAIGGYYLFMGNMTLAISGFTMMVLVPISNALSSFLNYLHGKQLFKQFSLFGACYVVVPSLTTIITVWFTTDVLTLFLMYIFSQTFAVTGLFAFTVSKYPPNKQLSTDSVSYGKHLSVMGIIGNLSLQLDKFLAWHLLGPVQLAAYTIIIALPQQLRSFNKLIVGFVYPRFSQRTILSIRQIIWHRLFLMELLAIVLTIIYWFGAPYLFEWLFPKYQEFVIYSQVFSLILLFLPRIVLVSVLGAHARTKELYWLRTALPILKMVFLVVFIPLLGLWGIFAAIFITEIISSLLTLWFFLRIPVELTET